MIIHSTLVMGIHNPSMEEWDLLHLKILNYYVQLNLNLSSQKPRSTNNSKPFGLRDISKETIVCSL